MAREKIQTRRTRRSNAFSLLPSRNPENARALPVAFFQSFSREKRPRDHRHHHRAKGSNTKGNRSSRLKTREKKKSNELRRTTSTFVLKPPSRRSAIDVDPSVAMGIGTSADGSSSLSLLAAVRKLGGCGCCCGWVVVFPGRETPMMMIRCLFF